MFVLFSAPSRFLDRPRRSWDDSDIRGYRSLSTLTSVPGKSLNTSTPDSEIKTHMNVLMGGEKKQKQNHARICFMFKIKKFFIKMR